MKNKLWFKTTASAVALIGIWLLYEACTGVYGNQNDAINDYFAQTTDHLVNSPSGIVSLPTNLPVPNDKNIKDATDRYWQIFYSVGDGQWWMGDSAAFSTKEFYWFGSSAIQNVSNGSAFAELTSVYDDDNSPTGRIVGPSPTGNVPSTAQRHVNPMPQGQEHIQLYSNRRPREKDIVVYIIDYKGALAGSHMEFIVPNIFEDLVDTSIIAFNTEKSSVVQNSSLNIKFTELLVGNNTSNPNQTSIFITLKVKADAENGNEVITPQVNFYHENDKAIHEVSKINDQTVLDFEQPHDPNKKTALNSNLTQADQYVTFKIEFQNEGSDTANLVIIKDSLDSYLDWTSVEVISPEPRPIVNPNLTNPIEFTYNNLGLRGTGEDGYGTLFHENDTKMSFIFKARIKDRKPCSAIVNRAQIYFECNPPVATSTAYATFNCFSPNVNRKANNNIREGSGVEYSEKKDSVKINPNFVQSCADTVIVKKLTTGISVGDTLTSNAEVNAILSQLSTNNFSTFHWYPSNVVLMANNHYTLVASKSCERRVYEFFTIDNCNLNLDISCSNQRVQATVHGAIGPLKWNTKDCDTSTTVYYDFGPNQKYIWVGVQDLGTGCSKEVKYELSAENCSPKIAAPSPPISFSWWLLAFLVAGIGLWWFFFRK